MGEYDKLQGKKRQREKPIFEKKRIMLATHTLTISVQRSAGDTYNFIANPENLPRWAPGLCLSVERTEDADVWNLNTSIGPATARFTPKNEFGVLDHYVKLSTGVEVYVPLRVISNQSGCEIIFTVFRLPEMTDEQFSVDIAAVQKDLQALKQLMESGA